MHDFRQLAGGNAMEFKVITAKMELNLVVSMPFAEGFKVFVNALGLSCGLVFHENFLLFDL